MTVRNGCGRAYEAGRVVAWKKSLHDRLSLARPERMLVPPISVCLVFEYERPADHLSKRTGKPTAKWQPIPYPKSLDVDNLAKPVLDVMTKTGWWDDDGGVSCLCAEKRYSDRNRVLIVAEEISLTDGGSSDMLP